MKIVMLTGLFHPHIGGAEKETKRLALQFKERSNNVILIAHHYKNTLKKRDFLYNIPLFRYKTLILKKRDFILIIRDFISILFLVKKFDPNIIYSSFSSMNLFLSLLLKKILRIPVVSSIRGTDIHTVPKKNIFYKKMIKWNLENVDMVFPVARALYQEAQKYADVSKKMRIIHGEVDISKFESIEKKMPLIEKYQLKNKFIIMTLCRLTRIKRIDIVLHSFKIVLSSINKSPDGREIVLMICGDGEEKERLIRLSKELGVFESVIFTGWIPYKEVPSHLSLADLYTSTSEYEGFSHTTIEAMLSGLPVIATDILAYKDILKDSGFLVPLNDPESLSEAIIDLILDKNKRERIAKEVQQVAIRNYAQKNTISDFLESFETVIEQER